jgi:hypothetical protein
VSSSLKLIARKLTKSANFADYSPNCSPMLTITEDFEIVELGDFFNKKGDNLKVFFMK